MGETKYIFSKDERILFLTSVVIYVIIILYLIFDFWVVEPLNDGWIGIGSILIGGLCLIFINGIKYTKYRYAKYAFVNESVEIIMGNMKRCISRNDTIYVSKIGLLHARRYDNLREDFIVLWKIDSKAPKEEISPYVCLKKYDVIILPLNQEVQQQLKQILGITEILEFPDRSLTSKGHISAIYRYPSYLHYSDYNCKN